MPRKGPRTKEQNERAAKQKKARQQKKKEEEEKAKQEKRAKDAERKRRQRANQKAREEAAAKAEAAMDPNQPHIPPTPDTPKPVETPVHLRGTYTATPRQSSVAVRRTPWSQSATRTPNHGGPTTREAAMTVAANLMSASKDTAKSVESEGDKNREAQLSIATNLASVASKLADVSANLASASKDQQSFMASEAEKNRQAQLRCLEIAENAPDDEDDFEQPQYIATNDENFEQIATDLNSRFTAASNQFEPIKEEEDEEEDDKKMSGVDLSAGDDDEELVPKTDDERTKNEKQEEVFTTTESSPTKMNSSENETSPTAKKTPTTSGTPFYMFGSETPSNSATTFGNNATTAPGVRFASNANQPNSNGSIGVGAGFTFGTTTVNTNSTATTPLFFGTTAIPTNTNGPVGINFGTSTGGVTFGATHPTSGSMSQSYTVPTKNPSTNAGQMGSGFVANEITKKMKAGSKLAKRLYSTGSNDAGTLVLSEDDNCGLAEEEDKHLPTEIRKVKDGVGTYDTIVQVETGQDCSFVLYQSGKVYSFGVSGTELARDGSDDDEALQVLPILQYDGVALDDKVFIVKMSAAAGILLLLDKNGRVFFSGSFSDDNNNKFCPPRQVGNIDISYDPTKTSPFILPLGEKKAVDICVSDKIAAIKCQDGSLLSFGVSNAYGQLGRRTQNFLDNLTPKAVEIPNMKPGAVVTSFAVGNFHMLVVTSQGQGNAFSCGMNTQGQLGKGRRDDYAKENNLAVVEGLYGVIQVAAGSETSFFLKNDGTVWSCGKATEGTLGRPPKQIEDATGEVVAVTVEETPAACTIAFKVSEIGAKEDLSWAYSKSSKGAISCWISGANSEWQAGVSTSERIFVPTKLKLPKGQQIAQFAGGNVHSLILTQEEINKKMWRCFCGAKQFLAVQNCLACETKQPEKPDIVSAEFAENPFSAWKPKTDNNLAPAQNLKNTAEVESSPEKKTTETKVYEPKAPNLSTDEEGANEESKPTEETKEGAFPTEAGANNKTPRLRKKRAPAPTPTPVRKSRRIQQKRDGNDN